MESDIFSVSVCGAHVTGNRGAGEETVSFSFGEHWAAWPGASGFFVLNFFLTVQIITIKHSSR